MTSKYRIRPVPKQGCFTVEAKGFIFWGPAWYITNFDFKPFYDNVEEAERDIQKAVRDELWPKAVPVTYYDSRGRRVKNSS